MNEESIPATEVYRTMWKNNKLLENTEDSGNKQVVLKRVDALLFAPMIRLFHARVTNRKH